MSFIKNLVKEIKTVKSMIDIPDLKNERDRINKRMEELNKSYEKHRLIADYETRIRQVMRDLEDVSEICFEGQEEYKNSAKQVIDALANRVEEAEKSSKSIEEEISRVTGDLQRVNDKLSAARAAVR
jgi:predicted  nucleic acid-binding Zn-ribbon protein